MPMPDAFSGTITPREARLQEVPAGFTGHRVVESYPPKEVDFWSAYELGKVPSPTQQYRSYAWFGVSLFENYTKAERMAQTARGRNKAVWIAELRFRPDSGIYGVYNARTTHLEVFAYPQELLALVAGVHP
jgi:hypothetical protein